ncbi:hypothetical protein [Nocardia heshunensis]
MDRRPANALLKNPPPAARNMSQDQFPGATLHILWIGLNDLITAERPVPDSGAAKPGTGIGPKDGPGATPANISFVQMDQFMQHVSTHQAAFQLTPLAQDHGPVPYLGMVDRTAPAIRRALTTSDLAHPTQAVYELIARARSWTSSSRNTVWDG